jgi:peptidoglycan/xylan/chitin deacetylase (PgdA/CDA1 family)
LIIGLTIDAVGTPAQFFTILDFLSIKGIKATFFIGTNIDKDIITSILDQSHEIGSHTFSHPASFQNLSFEEKEREIVLGQQWLMNHLCNSARKIKIRGFRAPYYNFDPDIPRILEKIGCYWDSTKAYFPLLGKRFKAKKYNNIIELPSLHPDDHTLIRRIGLTETQVSKIWKETYDMSEDVFIWGIHPYICAENVERSNMLKNFVQYIIDKGGKFLTMSEIASAHELD